MATRVETIDYILDQASGAGEVRAQKMFGEYALYVGDKVVALVCDDQLFVKVTEPGRAYAEGRFKDGFAYPGAKVSMQIDDDALEDREWLAELLSLTAAALPVPKPKAKKVK